MTFKTSIIVLTFNCLRYTQACLLSIRQHTSQPYELIVVDNASDDGSLEYLQSLSDITLIANNKNQGYSRGNNQGIQAASGDFVLLLNNDVIVTPNWLNLLINHFNHCPELGVLGPRTNQISGIQKLNCQYQAWDIAAINSMASQRQSNFSGQLTFHFRVAGFCMMLSRAVVEQVGGLDERFGTGNYEDDDLCKRAIQAGFKVGIAEDVFIHHFGSVSFLENHIDYQKLMRHNREEFLKKWGEQSNSSTRAEIQRLIPHQYQNILDIGCLDGSLGKTIKERELGARVVGVENNSELIPRAKNNLDELLEGNILDLKLPFKANEFDCIIFNQTLEKCQDPKLAVKDMLPFLKENGIFILVINNFRHYSILKDLISGQWHYHKAGLLGKDQLHFFTLNEIVTILESLAINIDRCHSIELAPADPDEVKVYQQFEEHLSQLGLFANGLATDMLVYQYIVIGGSQSHTLERKKRYEIDRLNIYWKESISMDSIVWTSISSTHSLDSNITVHVNLPGEININSGTLINIARIPTQKTYSLEEIERLKNMDDIWVVDQENKLNLSNSGISDKQIFVLPLLNESKNSKNWEQNVSNRILILCEQQCLLRSASA